MWSVHHQWLLLLFKERSPFPAATWGPSHGRQLSMNCSNLSPSHGQQFSIKCSNMDCSSTGYSCSGTACSSKGLQGHKSHHETCPSMGSSLQTSLPRSCSGPGFPWVHSLKQAPALACGFSKGCRWFCVSHDRPWAVVLQLQQEKLSSSHFTSMLLCPRTSFFLFKICYYCPL